jgi:hypothetical protein
MVIRRIYLLLSVNVLSTWFQRPLELEYDYGPFAPPFFFHRHSIPPDPYNFCESAFSVFIGSTRACEVMHNELNMQRIHGDFVFDAKTACDKLTLSS